MHVFTRHNHIHENARTHASVYSVALRMHLQHTLTAETCEEVDVNRPHSLSLSLSLSLFLSRSLPLSLSKELEFERIDQRGRTQSASVSNGPSVDEQNPQRAPEEAKASQGQSEPVLSSNAQTRLALDRVKSLLLKIATVPGMRNQKSV